VLFELVCKGDQTTLGLSPFTNKFKQHLSHLPLQTRSNNTWLISLYKQDQTTLGLSPFVKGDKPSVV
jgi:hypothetical protein